MATRKQIPLRIPQDLAEAVEAMARREGRSINNMIEQLLRRAVDAQAQPGHSAGGDRREVRRSARLK